MLCGVWRSTVSLSRFWTPPWLLVGLDDCLQDLRDLLPALHGREGRDYVLRLTRMAELILSDPKTAQT